MVLYLSSQEIIYGFSDGTFKPNDTVTRAQAAIMIGRALDLNGNQRDTTFRDVTSNVTGSGYIAAAVEKGIISGFSDGTYRPYQPVSRGQMAIFLNRAFTLSIGETMVFVMFLRIWQPINLFLTWLQMGLQAGIRMALIVLI